MASFLLSNLCSAFPRERAGTAIRQNGVFSIVELVFGVPWERAGTAIRLNGVFPMAELVFGVPWERAGTAIRLNGAFPFAELALGVPGERAAPRPLFRARSKASLHGVVVNIRNGLLEVRFIAHKAIPIFAVPEGMERLLPVGR